MRVPQNLRDVIINEENYVDPINQEINIQRAKNMGRVLKTFFHQRYKYGTIYLRKCGSVQTFFMIFLT
ncbi:hypothetical protein HZS_5541 [Henneguya salminicola]|nr:hypothetical protein HZS_5541 [Henneguya salminicola]